VFSLIHGDALSQTIAASSILAKVTRDRWMVDIGKKYPHFQFEVHKGYPTPKHLSLLKRHGPIQGIHRPTFAPVRALIHSNIKTIR
jgi:ribonuclease HII